MAKARFCKGLRRGSTKTETYSTLATRKDGRIQIIKDRVTDITNPQTDLQMLNRVCFVTASQAAAKMYDIISISQEGESKPEYARQLFISQNTEFLKKAAYKRVGLARHYRAAYAPKGNQQLIPNSYQVSKGSLIVPEVLVPKTTDGGSSFQYSGWDLFGTLNPLTVGSSYDAAQLWQILFGLLPGDQITIPQIGGRETAQAMYAGEDETSELLDKTLVTTFVAPRLVLKSEMPTTTIEIRANTTDADIANIMKAGIDNDSSFAKLVKQLFDNFIIDEVVDQELHLKVDETYGTTYGVVDDVKAVGVILSRYDSERKKWLYSTSNLCCIWDFLSEGNGAYYFGFTVDNAIATYRKAVSQNANGNFLQRGGTPDIVPASFR